MGGSAALAAAVTAVLVAAASPVSARWVLTVPDPAIRRWWRPSAAPRPGRTLVAAVAALGAVAGALGGAAAGWTPALPAFALLALLAAPLAVIDVRTHRLPDRLTATAALGVGALLMPAAALGPGLPGAARVLGGGALAFALLCALRIAAPAGLGFGDVKLGGALGLALGWHGVGAVLAGLVAGFALGAAGALAMLLLRRATLRTAIAFGPPLILGALLVAALTSPP